MNIYQLRQSMRMMRGYNTIISTFENFNLKILLEEFTEKRQSELYLIQGFLFLMHQLLAGGSLLSTVEVCFNFHFLSVAALLTTKGNNKVNEFCDEVPFV